MIISASGGKKEYAPCPEYTGRAVCVDVSPLKEYETQYGVKQKFKFVFEIDLPDDSRDPVQPWVVMTAPMVPSLHEKAALTKFLKDWFGRKLTDQENKSLDLEALLGRPANVVIVHEQSADGQKTYANIKLIQPHKSGEALQPSGLWQRFQDRPAKDEQRGDAGNEKAGNDSTYRKTTGGGQPADNDPSKVKVHVGKHKGIELRELTEEAINGLIEHWLPGAKANPAPKADDKRLITALAWYGDKFKAAELEQAQKDQDDLPY
jgi:hypothetical protein